MEFRFNFERSLQAAAHLLAREGGVMEYIRLLKLMYAAERELLAESAMPLTGDIYKAMDRGPVLSDVLDLIKRKHWRHAEWSAFIEKFDYDVKLVADPGQGDLSPIILAKLNEVSDRFRGKKWGEVVDITHDFPEWMENYRQGTSTPIPLNDILKALGAEDGTIDIIREDEAARRQMELIIDSNKAKVSA